MILIAKLNGLVICELDSHEPDNKKSGISAAIATRKLQSADPADIFKKSC
ncbi:hypothetical protein [Pleurocapsa sp. FMAR1]|nr:hypothetical protein [Pleurocapsa sp. FMAR1]